MRTKILVMILSLLLVLIIAGCSIIGVTWSREPDLPVEPNMIPLQAPLRRVLFSVQPLAGLQPGQDTLVISYPTGHDDGLIS
jgi:hypothetical protein